MACNCATNEQIKELYRRYGDKKNANNVPTGQKIKNAVAYTGVVLAMIPIVPILFLYVLYKALCDDDHRISLTRFFRLDKKELKHV